jgi:hypothetical protein
VGSEIFIRDSLKHAKPVPPRSLFGHRKPSVCDGLRACGMGRMSYRIAVPIVGRE